MDDLIIDIGSGMKARLPDISYDHFTEFLFKQGVSDSEYDKYLRDNNMKYLTDFNSESTEEIELIIENSGRNRVLKYRCYYDSDNDEEFDGNEYFKFKEGTRRKR